jgi:phosphate transport system substrate-binding protein
MRIRGSWLLVVLLGSALVIIGCGRRTGGRGTLQVKGSNTMLQLGQAWAEEFNKTSPTKVSISGEGSGVGISALISGTTDIAETSREMKPEEIKQAKAKGVEAVQTTVAWDGLAVVVNPSNPVRKLTMDQLRDLFLGNVKNWRELGGPDEQVIIVTRDTSSGSHEYFLEHVLRRGNPKGKEDFPNTALVAPSSQAAVQSVSQDKGGIAYVGLGYVSSKVADVAIAKSKGGPYVKPAVGTVMDRSYPISRPLYFYTNGKPTGAVKEYVDFVLSDEGQRVVEREGFVPIGKSRG